MYTMFDDPSLTSMVYSSWIPTTVLSWPREIACIFLSPWITCLLRLIIWTFYILPTRGWRIKTDTKKYCTILKYNSSISVKYVHQVLFHSICAYKIHHLKHASNLMMQTSNAGFTFRKPSLMTLPLFINIFFLMHRVLKDRQHCYSIVWLMKMTLS